MVAEGDGVQTGFRGEADQFCWRTESIGTGAVEMKVCGSYYVIYL